jgi:hypothetical protein
MSTLGYAILGLLATQPRTGYDLARLMRTPIGYMWTLEADAVDDPTSYVFDEYATLRYGIMRVRETIAWFDWLLDRLDRLHPTARLAADTSGAANQPD